MHLSEADTALVVRLCREKNVILAGDATPATINARIAEGYRLLSVGWDYSLLNDALGGTVKALRGAIK